MEWTRVEGREGKGEREEGGGRAQAYGRRVWEEREGERSEGRRREGGEIVRGEERGQESMVLGRERSQHSALVLGEGGEEI